MLEGGTSFFGVSFFEVAVVSTGGLIHFICTVAIETRKCI